MDAAKLVTQTAATWRITRLITQDEIARPVRAEVHRRWPGSKIAYLVECPYCVSVWAGLAVASGLVPDVVIRGLAFSAGSLAARWVNEAVEVTLSNRRL